MRTVATDASFTTPTTGDVPDISHELGPADIGAPIHAEPFALREIHAELRAALAEFERASGAVGDVAKKWGDEALTGPALKAECIIDLMAPAGAVGMARSSAEKAVTSHPIYAAHKERLDELARQKHDAETAADVARVRVNVLLELAALARTAALTGA